MQDADVHNEFKKCGVNLLLAVPFTPNWAEYLYLKNSKRIIGDQQRFLKTRFPRGSQLL